MPKHERKRPEFEKELEAIERLFSDPRRPRPQEQVQLRMILRGLKKRIIAEAMAALEINQKGEPA